MPMRHFLPETESVSMARLTAVRVYERSGELHACRHKDKTDQTNNEATTARLWFSSRVSMGSIYGRDEGVLSETPRTEVSFYTNTDLSNDSLLLHFAWLSSNCSDAPIKTGDSSVQGPRARCNTYLPNHYTTVKGCFLRTFEALLANLILVLPSFG